MFPPEACYHDTRQHTASEYTDCTSTLHRGFTLHYCGNGILLSAGTLSVSHSASLSGITFTKTPSEMQFLGCAYLFVTVCERHFMKRRKMKTGLCLNSSFVFMPTCVRHSIFHVKSTCSLFPVEAHKM